MRRAGIEEEVTFLERVAQYREEYRTSRDALLKDERAAGHASGEVYVAGVWVPQGRVDEVSRMLQRREYLVFAEIVVLMVALIALAIGESQLFAFLFMP